MTTNGFVNGSVLQTAVINASSLATDSNGKIIAGAGGGGGSLTLIATKSASNSASITFTSGITGTYNNYLLTIDSCQMQTTAQALLLLLSTDGGSTYIASNYFAATNSWQFTTGAWTPLTISTSFLLTYLVSTGLQDIIGSLFLQNMTSGSGNVGIQGQTVSNSGSILGTNLVTGYYDGGAITVNAIQLISTAGNLVSGNFSLYGFSK